jgi:hypothetical protein
LPAQRLGQKSSCRSLSAAPQWAGWIGLDKKIRMATLPD